MPQRSMTQHGMTQRSMTRHSMTHCASSARVCPHPAGAVREQALSALDMRLETDNYISIYTVYNQRSDSWYRDISDSDRGALVRPQLFGPDFFRHKSWGGCNDAGEATTIWTRHFSSQIVGRLQ
jgi:hypothetical protein